MRLKEAAATVAVGVAFIATPVLGKAIVDTRHDDCERNRALAVGIHSILNRSTKRTEQYVKKHVITEAQAQATRKANRRNVAAIKLPEC